MSTRFSPPSPVAALRLLPGLLLPLLLVAPAPAATDIKPPQDRSRTAVTVAPTAKDRPQASGTPESDALVKAADELRKKGDFPAALKKVQEALKKVPKHPQGLLLAGTLEGAMGRSEDALGHLKAAVAVMPENLFARKVYATLLMERHDPALAMEVLGPVLAARPIDTQAHTLAAQIAAAAADYDGARADLEPVFKADPGFAPAHELAAKIAFASRQPEAAQPHLEALLKARPDDIEAMLTLANLEYRKGRFEQAAGLLARARDARPKQPEPLIASAQFALQQHQLQDAETYIQRLGAVQADNASLLSLQGQLALAQGRPKDAVAPLEAALAHQPLPEIFVQLHQALLASDQKDQAEARLKTWLSEHPADQRMRFYAAETAARRQDYAAASALYRSILDKEPGNLVALNDLAQTLQAQHDPTAVDVAEQAHKLQPDNPMTESTLGGILMANGKTERGLALLHDAAVHAPQNPEVRYDYARALASAGDKVQARSELEALLALKRPFADEAAARDLLKQLGGS